MTVKTVWELKVDAKSIILDQSIHLTKIIDLYNPTAIINYNNFKHWEHLSTTQGTSCDLLLYAHTKWQTLSDIVNDLVLFDTNLIFLAVNKYLLLPQTINNNLPEDYNEAIKAELTYLLPAYSVVEYEYHADEIGNVGNFVIPDNRFLLKCVNQ